MTTIESLEARQLLASVSVRGDDFLIDGRITHANSQLAGTLPNIRAANATFDDANPTTASKWKYPDTRKWDANRNTSEFIAQLPNWKKAGVLAVTLSFQGGGPVNNQFGPSQPWDSGAFNRDGSIRSAHLARMEKAIAALNANGMIAIVNYFYLGQENRLRDNAAVYKATDNATTWLKNKGFRNVIVDVVNESRPTFKNTSVEPSQVHSLINRVKQIAGGRFLVGTSYPGGVLPSASVVGASDVIILHGNGINSSRLKSMIQTMRKKTSKPILINEDSTSMSNFRAATSMGVSWGYYDQGRNNYYDGVQSMPIRWAMTNTTVKRAFVSELARLKRPTAGRPTPPAASIGQAFNRSDATSPAADRYDPSATVLHAQSNASSFSEQLIA
ncbi:MAG TPA: hypothetical protein PLD59_00660 [Tepidisphaeraceae bacterium]|nr:hypothetical protein [Tepidisphaeraceae bacterium]